MAPKKLDWTRITPSPDVRYHQPRSSGVHDGFSVKVECKDPDDGQYYPLIHQGPMLRIPFGLKKKEGKYGARYYCDLAFPGVTQDADTQEFVGADADALQFLKYVMAIEEENKSRALGQSLTWFKKQLKPEIIEEFYFRNVSFSSKPQMYSPVFSTKIQCSDDGVFRTNFFNQYKKQIKFEDIGTGLSVIPLLEAKSLWFAGKSFGMSWKLIQLLVFEREEFKGCAFDMDAYADYMAPQKPLGPSGAEDYGGGYEDDAYGTGSRRDAECDVVSSFNVPAGITSAATSSSADSEPTAKRVKAEA